MINQLCGFALNNSLISFFLVYFGDEGPAGEEGSGGVFMVLFTVF